MPGRYFIPHHALVKKEDKELEIRDVFEASVKSTSGMSLNWSKDRDSNTKCRFRSRFNRYIFVANITKMYWRIQVHEDDCAYQHLLKRRSSEEVVQEYKLFIVTYAVNAAPFIELCCLRN